MSTTYILIPICDENGLTIDNEMYYVDSLAEIESAQEALRAAGMAEAPVWAGEGEDAILTGQTLYAG